MPLTGAERARLYRLRKKENEQEYANYLHKEKSRYQKRKERGDIKSISSMTEREKRITRKAWRVRKRKERQKNNTFNIEFDTTPPTPTGPFPVRLDNPSRQRKRRDRAKAYREIDKLKQKVSNQKRIIERYKKRLYRHSLKSKNANSPRTQTKKLLRGQKVNQNVKRTLLFHHVFLQGIKEKYQQSKSERSKHLLSKALCSNILKKYRMQKVAKHQLNLSQRRINQSDGNDMTYARKPRRMHYLQSMKKEKESFLCREDNSRVKGKKSTKTKLKTKRQIHLLNDTLKNLHMKYLSENTTRKMSYSLFCRLKLFYIQHARESDRQTCLCKRHENLQYKVNKLKQLKILNSTDLEDIAKRITCGTENINCMYRTCKVCLKKTVQLENFESGQMVEWYEWKTRKIEKQSHEKDTETKMKSITVKEREKGTLRQLTSEFQDELSKCCKHLYNIKHQFKAIRQLKQKLSEKDVLIHIDFSENLSCKYSSEIQSMHFGASQRQISLHTEVCYTSEKTIPFCSISDNLKHGPPGIWAHMKPILELVKVENPSVVNLYVLSDGPTTQYRCKENFYLLTTLPFKDGYKSVNWNFTEAGHGKGAPDGIGAVVKREADRAVSHGFDITDAKVLFDTLTGRGLAVKLFLIQDEDFSRPEVDLKSQEIRTVSGTMKIHQIYTTNTGEIYHRNVSCFCKAPKLCDCFNPEKALLTNHQPSKTAAHSPQLSTNTDGQPSKTAKPPCASQLSANTVDKPDIDETLKGQYCVVSYDNKPYPGVVVDVDDGEVEVQVMHSIGKNRFYWPMMPDVLWYDNKHLLRLIDLPEKVTNRHYQINKEVWAVLEQELDI